MITDRLCEAEGRQRRGRVMASDIVLLMKGLAKLSQAVLETQSGVLSGGGAVTQSIQMTAAQAMGVAMQKIQVILGFSS